MERSVDSAGRQVRRENMERWQTVQAGEEGKLGEKCKWCREEQKTVQGGGVQICSSVDIAGREDISENMERSADSAGGRLGVYKGRVVQTEHCE